MQNFPLLTPFIFFGNSEAERLQITSLVSLFGTYF